jgi:prevent-host-death family protein
MTEVSVRDLRNHGGDLLDSVMSGESLTVTRRGKPVAELRPIAAAGTLATTLLERWHAIPVLDLAALWSDLDEVPDSTL